MKETNFCDLIIVFKNGEDTLLDLNDIYRITYKLPQVIFLNLNISTMDGKEYLAEFIQLPNNSLENTVTYMVSYLLNNEDTNEVEGDMPTNYYILKPITLNNFKTILKVQLVLFYCFSHLTKPSVFCLTFESKNKSILELNLNEIIIPL